MMDGIKKLEGRKVFIETDTNRRYSGTIISVDEDLKFIYIEDKFKEKVWISFDNIKTLQEERV